MIERRTTLSTRASFNDAGFILQPPFHDHLFSAVVSALKAIPLPGCSVEPFFKRPIGPLGNGLSRSGWCRWWSSSSHSLMRLVVKNDAM